jgi:protein involved in polysaccharide export with SLBB domain
VIEPDDYRVGPGDIIFVNIWTTRPEQYEIEITPEATLIVPGVGDLSVKGMTLTELKTATITRLRAYYSNTPISITLGKVRRFRVTVTGAVDRPGLHIVTANTRASEVLEAAGLKSDAASRQVRLERADTTIQVDLAAFERLGLREANPYLYEGDVLIAPPIDSRWGNVQVEGAVNLAGTFGFSPGDLVGDLIDLGYGLRADADSTRIELWRFPQGADEAVRLTWPDGTSYSDWRRFALQPDDRVFVRAIEGFRRKRSVRVTGEVHRRGFYAFAGESISLRSVIDSAGGFTPFADLSHALVVRSQQPAWVKDNRERVGLVPSELRSQTETDIVYADALTVQGRLSVDFEKLFVQGDETHNVLLIDGDEVVVPRLTENINIIGRVVQPGLVPLKPGAGLQYYIERAGGFSWQADRGGTFLVKGATGVAIKKRRVEDITAGDTIVVPTKRGRRWWSAFRETLTVTTSLATLYLVIDQVTQ